MEYDTVCSKKMPPTLRKRDCGGLPPSSAHSWGFSSTFCALCPQLTPALPSAPKRTKPSCFCPCSLPDFSPRFCFSTPRAGALHCAPRNELESLKNTIYTYTSCHCYHVRCLRHTKNNIYKIPISLYFRRVRSSAGDQV